MQQQKAAAAGLAASSEGLFDHPTEDITIAGTTFNKVELLKVNFFN